MVKTRTKLRIKVFLLRMYACESDWRETRGQYISITRQRTTQVVIEFQK